MAVITEDILAPDELHRGTQGKKEHDFYSLLYNIDGSVDEAEEQLEAIDSDVQLVKNAVVKLNTDLTTLIKSESETINTSITANTTAVETGSVSIVEAITALNTALTNAIAGIKTDIAGVKSDIAGVKTDVAGVKTQLDTIEGKLPEA